MIYGISSDLPGFKNLSFHEGLNILLADKSPGASERQGRNGAGKTSFVNLVHFLCGGKADPNDVFRSDALRDATFDMSVRIGGDDLSIYRCGKKPNDIQVNGSVVDWPISPKPAKDTESHVISNDAWKSTLGNFWFGLPATVDLHAKYSPSFRSLFSYFARRQENGGFQEHALYFSRQQPWDQQVSLSYLVGLDWKPASDLQLLRGKEKVAKDLRRAASSGDLGQYMARPAEIRTQSAVAERRVEIFRKRMDEFQVVPEYRSLEQEAGELTVQINQLGEENFIDDALIGDLKLSLEEEEKTDNDDEKFSLEDEKWPDRLANLYNEAGVVLPGGTMRRLSEVREFHAAVIGNRRSHLQSEIQAAESRIKMREKQKTEIESRRSEIMEILRSGGALEQYTELSEELGRAEADVETLKQRLELAERIEASKSDIRIERAQLAQALRDDIHERKEIVQDAIIVFETLSEQLYEKAGSLTIDPQENGPKFEVYIDSQRSKGITNMQIFCFDLMLIEMCMKRGAPPGFLIHDSHLFDGVDERQIANALQIGARKAMELGFQYIVTMNSDALPSDGLAEDFNIDEYILPVRLTDEDGGGLFGVQF